MEDINLIYRARSGDAEAFEELIYKYDKLVLSIAYNYRADREDAKDIYQEVFLRVYNGLKNFEGKSEFSTWLYRITVNVCLDYFDKKKKHAAVSIDSYLEDEDSGMPRLQLADCDMADKALMEHETRTLLEDAIETLPPQQKMAFVLKYVKEHKIKEIAKIMDCTEGTVKKYLFNAVHKLRARMK